MNKIIQPKENIRAIIRKTEPIMSYNGQISIEEWSEMAREKLAELLGLNHFNKCPDSFQMEYEDDTKDFHEIRFVFQSEDGYFVPCHFCIPHGAMGKLPVMICLQGHGKGMHISLSRPKYEGDYEKIYQGERGFVEQIINNGYCALTLEQRNFGECGGTENGPDCQDSTLINLLIGRTTIGERVWDVQRAIDVLSKHFDNYIDKDQIMCMGNSGGGTATFYAACMDKRIKVAIPSCSVCEFDSSIVAIKHCSCNYIPKIREYFEMGDLGILIAPSILIIVAGEKDDIFPIEGTYKSYEKIKKMYTEIGYEKRCELVVGSEGHRFYASPTWSVLNNILSGVDGI